MKTIKKILDFFKRLFKRKEVQFNENNEVTIKPQRPKLMTNRDKRNAWLSSKGYTPREVVKSTKEIVKHPSHFTGMVIGFARAKRKGAKIYDNGLKGIFKKLIRNKQGIPFYENKSKLNFI